MKIFRLSLALIFGFSAAHAQVAAQNRAAVTVKQKANSVTQKPQSLAPVEVVQHAALSPEHLRVAKDVVTGRFPCELAAHVVVTANPHAEGRFILELGREKHFLEPVLTSTGAVRLEDVKTGVTWLQLANKSMLLNQQLGKRLADACMSDGQTNVAREMERSGAPGLLDGPAPVAAVPSQPAMSRPVGTGVATN
jgi:hypothetical protein